SICCRCVWGRVCVSLPVIPRPLPLVGLWPKANPLTVFKAGRHLPYRPQGQADRTFHHRSTIFRGLFGFHKSRVGAGETWVFVETALGCEPKSCKTWEVWDS